MRVDYWLRIGWDVTSFMQLASHWLSFQQALAEVAPTLDSEP